MTTKKEKREILLDRADRGRRTLLLDQGDRGRSVLFSFFIVYLLDRNYQEVSPCSLLTNRS